MIIRLEKKGVDPVGINFPFRCSKVEVNSRTTHSGNEEEIIIKFPSFTVHTYLNFKVKNENQLIISFPADFYNDFSFQFELESEFSKDEEKMILYNLECGRLINFLDRVKGDEICIFKDKEYSRLFECEMVELKKRILCNQFKFLGIENEEIINISDKLAFGIPGFFERKKILLQYKGTTSFYFKVIKTKISIFENPNLFLSEIFEKICGYELLSYYFGLSEEINVVYSTIDVLRKNHKNAEENLILLLLRAVVIEHTFLLKRMTLTNILNLSKSLLLPQNSEFSKQYAVFHRSEME